MANDYQPLKGRVAVVTGASSGIGAATAKLLAKRGASVALLARRKDRLDALVKQIEAEGGKALAIELDVTDAAATDAVADVIKSKLGPASLLFNNAGIMLPAPIEELRQADWDKMISINISGLMNAIHAFVPQLVESAKTGPSDLINTSSIAGENIFPTFAVYSGTKAFVHHVSKHLRAEIGAKNVRVNILAPGIVQTELQDHVTDKGALAWLEGSKESMEWLQPEDIAEVVAFTASLPAHVNLQQVTVMPTKQTS